MSYKKYVCSLEYARKLCELGIKQKSLFYWINIADYFYTDLEIPTECDEHYSALTSGELGDLLPNDIGTIKQKGIYIAAWDLKKYPDLLGKLSLKIKHEADARAVLLIYLIENGLYKIKGKKK